MLGADPDLRSGHFAQVAGNRGRRPVYPCRFLGQQMDLSFGKGDLRLAANSAKSPISHSDFANVEIRGNLMAKLNSFGISMARSLVISCIGLAVAGWANLAPHSALAQDIAFASQEGLTIEAASERYGFPIEQLPPGSVVRHALTDQGDWPSEMLQMEIPAEIGVLWDSGEEVDCKITLLVTRTHELPSFGGLPPFTTTVIAPVHDNAIWMGGFSYPVGASGRALDGITVEGEANDMAATIVPPPRDCSSPIGEINGLISDFMPNFGDDAVMDTMERMGQLADAASRATSEAEMMALMAEMQKLAESIATPQMRAMNEMMGEDQDVSEEEFFAAFPSLGRLSDILTTGGCGLPTVTTFTMLENGLPHEMRVRFRSVSDPDMITSDCPAASVFGEISVAGLTDLSQPIEVVSATPLPELLPGPEFATCTNVDPEAPLVTAEFNAPVDPDTLAGNAIIEEWSGGRWQQTELQFERISQTEIGLTPGQRLQPLRRYRLLLRGGIGGISGFDSGSEMAGEASIEFQTAPHGNDTELGTSQFGVPDFRAYQVVREAAFTPGKPVVTRTALAWPRAGVSTADLPQHVCLDVDVTVQKPSGQTQSLDTVPFAFKRDDLYSRDDKRLGKHKVLSTGYTPDPDDQSVVLWAEFRPINFVSANQNQEPPVYSLPDSMNEDRAVLADDFKLAIKVLVAEWADYTDHELIRHWNTMAEEMARRIVADEAAISANVARYTPSIGATVRMAPERPKVNLSFDDNAALESLFSTIVLAEAAIEGASFSARFPSFLSDLHAWERAGRKPASTSFNAFNDFVKRKILDDQIKVMDLPCEGREVCLVVIPWRLDRYTAFAQTQSTMRAAMVTPEWPFAPVNMPAERWQDALVHEVGHTFGLAHVPFDNNSEDEQTRIRNAIDAAGQIRWFGIDAVARQADGTYAFASTEEGNSRNAETLLPFMFVRLHQAGEMAIQTEQYNQFLTALRNSDVPDARYLQVFPTGASASRLFLHQQTWKPNN